MGSRRWQLPVAFTLLGIAGLTVAVYLDFYWEESRFLVDQNRRIVRRLSEQTAARFEDATWVFHTAALALYDRTEHVDGEADLPLCEEFTDEDRWGRFQAAIGKAPFLSLAAEQPKPSTRDPDVSPGWPTAAQIKTLRPELSTKEGRAQLRFGPLTWPMEGDEVRFIVFDLDPGVLLEGLQHAQLFDTVLIADGTGRVLHRVYERENGLAEEPFRQLDGLLATARQPTLIDNEVTTVSSVPHRFLANVGGSDYWVVMEPIELAAVGGEREATFWTIAGLLPARELQSESRDLPTTTVLLPTVVGLVFLALGYLWLKLWNAGAYEPFARLELALAGLSFAVLLGVLAASIYGLQMLHDQSDSMTGRVLAIRKSINDGFRTEIQLIVEQIRLAMPALEADYEEASEDGSCWGFRSRDGVVETGVGVGEERVIPFDTYRYFNQIYWLDKSGRQRVKWAATGTPTEPGRYQDRDYFEKPLEGHLYDSSGESGGRCTGYFMEAIKARTTGEARTVVAVVRHEEDELFGCSGSPGPDAQVIATSTSLYSLESPVLPEGIDFVVMSDDGKAHFSSNSDARFFEMLDYWKKSKRGEKQKRGVGEDGSGEPEECIDFSYHGETIRYCDGKLYGTDLRLVVFGNFESGRSAQPDGPRQVSRDLRCLRCSNPVSGHALSRRDPPGRQTPSDGHLDVVGAVEGAGVSAAGARPGRAGAGRARGSSDQ